MQLRNTGIAAVGPVHWGAHICHFYEGQDDLIDSLVPYFKAGVDGNERCLWVTADPLRAEDARRALRAVVPDLDTRARRGQVEIIEHEDWYARAGARNVDDVITGWLDREQAAIADGYTGLRLTGNTFWLQRHDWQAFTEYEARVGDAFRARRIVALCSYCLWRCTPGDVLDVVRNHQFAVARRDGVWEIVESARIAEAKLELERRVMERTAELEAAVQTRDQLLVERERVEAALRDADRRKDEFLAMLSHELRNPLMPIQTGLDVLDRAPSESGQAQQARTVVRRQLTHLRRLVDDLLDITRITRGKVHLRRELVDLRDLLHRVVDDHRGLVLCPRSTRPDRSRSVLV